MARHWEEHECPHILGIELTKVGARIKLLEFEKNPAAIIEAIVNDYRNIADILEQLSIIVNNAKKELRD